LSLITGLEAWWATTEADVIAAIAAIKADIAIAITDIEKALSWVNANVPAINADIAEVNGALTTVAAAGIHIPAAVTTAIADANKAVSALNSYQQIVAQGGTATAALLAGYGAIKQAQSSSALATLAVVNMPNPVPAAPQ
jgi:hypothetical protein